MYTHVDRGGSKIRFFVDVINGWPLHYIKKLSRVLAKLVSAALLNSYLGISQQTYLRRKKTFARLQCPSIDTSVNRTADKRHYVLRQNRPKSEQEIYFKQLN